MTLVFISQTRTEPKLEQTIRYRAFLSSEEQKKVLDELAKNCEDLDEYGINMYIDIELKKYRNDPKNT